MPKVRIQSTKPNTDIDNETPSSRGVEYSVNASIDNDIPNVKTAHTFQATTISTPSGISAGMPIGLLLALTYAADPGPTTETIVGEKPSVKIKDY